MDRGRAIYQILKQSGIRYLIWLPDSETHFMHEAILNDSEIKLIKVCREGEAFAICCGLHMGGEKGAILIENNGLFDSGNALKYVIGLQIPLVMLVGYLGFAQMKRTPQGMMSGGNKKDYTEPFLDAFGIQYYLVESDGDLVKVEHACRETQELKKPVTVLLTSADGFKPGN
jgi:sulfopyruvate decarboxylase subunit alpha